MSCKRTDKDKNRDLHRVLRLMYLRCRKGLNPVTAVQISRWCGERAPWAQLKVTLLHRRGLLVPVGNEATGLGHRLWLISERGAELADKFYGKGKEPA